jgi:hypothetical protein
MMKIIINVFTRSRKVGKPPERRFGGAGLGTGGQAASGKKTKRRQI